MEIDRIEIALTLDSKGYSSKLDDIERQTSSWAKGLGGMFKDAFSFAMGGLIEKGILGIGDALKSQGSQTIDAIAKNERLTMSMESLIAGEISRGSAIDKVVGQQIKAIGITEKEQKELDKLNGGLEEETFKRDQLKDRISILRGEINSMVISNDKDVISHNKKVEALQNTEFQYKKLSGTVSEHQARIAELTGLQNNLVASDVIVKERQLSVNDAMAQASVLAQNYSGWMDQVAFKSPFSKDSLQDSFTLAMNYQFLTGSTKGYQIGLEGIKQAQTDGVVTADRLLQATVDMAAVNVNGAVAAEAVTRALGQMNANQKVSKEELNQLTEAGFPAIAVLDNLGYSLDDVTAGLVDHNAYINAAVKLMEEDFGGAAARQAKTWDGLFNTLSDFSNRARVEIFGPTADAIKSYLLPALDSMITPERIQQLSDLGDKMGNFVQGIVDELPRLGPLVDDVFKRLTKAVDEGGISGLLDEIGKLLGEGWETFVKPTLVEWKDKFWSWITGGDGISGVQADITPTLDKLIQGISDFLSTSWPTIKQELTKWNNMFWDWVTGPGGVLEKVNSVMDKLTDKMIVWATLPNSQNQIAQVGNLAGIALIDGLNLTISNQEKINKVIGNLIVALGKAVIANVLLQNKLGGDIGNGMIDGIIQTVAGPDASKEVVQNIKEGLFEGVLRNLNPVAQFLGVGKSIVDGIAGGIDQNSNIVSRTISDLINEAERAARNAGLIHSPSGLFEEGVGDPIGMGVVKGMLGTIPAIQQAASSVINAASEVGNRAMGGSGLGNTTNNRTDNRSININYNNTQPKSGMMDYSVGKAYGYG